MAALLQSGPPPAAPTTPHPSLFIIHSSGLLPAPERPSRSSPTFTLDGAPCTPSYHTAAGVQGAQPSDTLSRVQAATQSPCSLVPCPGVVDPHGPHPLFVGVCLLAALVRTWLC